MSNSGPHGATQDAWPRLEWEPQVWLPASGWGVNSEFGSGGRPYKSSVPAPIASLTPEPDTEAGEAAEAAVQELSRFDAELGTRVAGFAPVLLRSEAASSSQIENLTASARAIFSAELGSKSSRNAELIAANTRAMQAAIDLSDALSPTAIAEMHRVLMGDQVRHTPGEWRREAVWIGTKSNSPIGAEFVAPQFERVPALIDDVVAFSARRDVPALTSTAVAHAQFETIHPFTDGNGRTGRAFAQALLRHRGVTRNVAVPVSAGLLADVEGYHRALTAYREGDVSPIVLAFAEASLRAVANSRELITEIDAIKEGWRGRLTVRRSSNAWALLDVIAQRPVIDSATAAAALGVKQPNVYPALQTLTEAGILKSKSEHRSGPFWRSDEVLAAIDRFAERAGRRERS
ncbi:Fic family protein [Herbiconiux solani]|uniref:Fic family protein n=1 Tax=Herbiconiux solani TaxID=661329 RepID=UPI0008255724|nr:Fic family protein [Herbiconiux solani]